MIGPLRIALASARQCDRSDPSSIPAWRCGRVCSWRQDCHSASGKQAKPHHLRHLSDRLTLRDENLALAVANAVSCSGTVQRVVLDLIVYEAFVLALTAGLVLLACPFAAERRAMPLLGFIGLALVQTLVLTVPLALGWHLGRWNWVGKLASIAVGLAAIRVLRLGRTEIGLVWPQGRSAWLVSAAGLVAGLILVTLFVLVLGPNPHPDAETLAYQATLPGLDEELAFRGLGMALLARGLPVTRAPKWVLPLVITSLQFTAGHVVNIEHGHLGLALGAALFVLPMGLLLGLIRVGSSSLLGCVVTHNAVNLTGYLAAFVLPATSP